MTYQEFLIANRSKLLGYFILAELSTDPDTLATAWPPDALCEETLDALKDQLRNCIPMDSIIIDLWDWDIHFEEYLSDAWYFDAVFGAASSLEQCAEELAEFFLEKCDELGLDYDQSPDDPEFESLIEEQARNFILGWRESIFARYAKPVASGEAPTAARA